MAKTKDEVIGSLKRSPMKRGFYKDSKGKIRYLQDIAPLANELLVVYAPKASALKAFKLQSKMSVYGVNVNSSNIFEWFRKATYLGNTPETAGVSKTLRRSNK